MEEEEPPISLFPHQVRFRSIFTFLCCCHRGPHLNKLPGEIRWLICSWVKADFTQSLWDGTLHWGLCFYKAGSYWEWISNIYHGRPACSLCLSFKPDRSHDRIPDAWKCNHTVDWSKNQVETLSKKYILP